MARALATADRVETPLAARDEPDGALPSTTVVVASAATGLALRLGLILGSGLGRADADESINGLMARHLLDGEFSTFFWGQPYGGSHESTLTAPLFAAFGPTTVVLKLLPILLAGVAAWLVWRVGRRTVGESAARVGALVFWVYPAVFAWWSTKSGGFYGVTLVLGLLTTLLALRLVERPSVADAAALGLAAGVGWWASPQITFYLLPAVVWALYRRPGLVRFGVFAAPAALLGAVPWLRYNLDRGWRSLDRVEGTLDYWYVLRNFVQGSLPLALGLRRPYDLDWLLGPVGIVAYLALLAGLAWVVLRRRGRAGPLLLLLVTFPVLFAFTPTLFEVQIFEPRYVWFVAPVLALLAATALGTRRRQAVVLAALGALSVVGLFALADWGAARPTSTVAPADLAPLLRTLEDRDVDRIFAPYSIAYRVSFESRERILGTQLEGIGRYRPHELAVLESPRPAYVVYTGRQGDRFLRSELDERGLRYERVVAGRHVVFLPAEKLLPSDIPGLNGIGPASL